VAVCAIVGIVSASVLAQMRQAPASDVKNSTAVFEATDPLLRPDDYREWILVSDDSERRPVEGEGVRVELTPARRVYINPEGYRAYMKTGVFSEGTVMIWESVRADADATRHPHPQSPALLASVKDSTRFDGGWGFFDFTGQDGRVISKAQPNAESSRCRTCHLEEAETDSVFTQFYSALRSARQGQAWGERRPQPTLAHS
jgi:hypothetical protein